MPWASGEPNETPALQSEEEADPRSALVRVLKSGKRKVYRKDVEAKYGSTKPDVRRETLERPSAYHHYKEVNTHAPDVISHAELGEVNGTSAPDYRKLLRAVVNTPVGNAEANNYHARVEALLTALFYPSLIMPEMEHEIHEGRKGIDFTYTNNAKDWFFAFLARHKISAQYVFVECKNYG
ncbi:hypothetical protein [Streptomyces sp. NRRL F-5650]|uniref:hypothetical protein n=1 Tax=Streptomyces sp. NRRL F-5650 TaxID=1463868 RepID=UPI00131EABDD|nr:hypothetical protein [Streptomyces sp. NRRL F-5650]